jgi:DNA-binding NtrC family response regulator
VVKLKILIVDDEPAVLQGCGLVLRKLPDAVVILEQDSRYAAELLEKERFDLLLFDLRMPPPDGRELLQLARKIHPEQSVMVLTGHPTVETAIECLKLGAADYVTKPVDPDEFMGRVQRILQEKRLLRENSLLMRQVERPHLNSDIIGGSAALRTIRTTIEKVAAADVDVLITGETGVGKELVARCIHRASPRAAAHFVPLDCGAVPEGLLESELFGYERGGLPGSDRSRMGLMEYADGGTLFLDEIGEMAAAVHPKFLRTLQERRFRRVGDTDEVSVNLRVITATNRDLPALIRQRQFREDLYYRIKVARIDIPPLRERPDDIPVLVHHFTDQTLKRMGRDGITLDSEAMELLTRYSWPGNVRELQNVLKWTLTMATGDRLTADHLPEEVVVTPAPAPGDNGANGAFFGLRAVQIARFEKAYLENLMVTHQGDVARAAVEAQLPRGTLYRMLKKYALLPEEFRK